MKNYIYILFLFCLVLSGCGLAEPWKDWQNECEMSDYRLRPSELKKVLCEPAGWKMIYEGVTFYFQFNEGGTLNSDTNEKMLDNALEDVTYSLDFQGEETLLISIQNGGMLQYLDENAESTLLVSTFSESEVVATGRDFGKTMTLVPVSTAELQQAKEMKRKAIIAYNKLLAVDKLKSELNNGTFCSTSADVLAHYLLSCDISGAWSLRVSYVENGIVNHEQHAVDINLTNDENAELALDSPVSVGGITIGKFYYNYLSAKLTTDNAQVQCDTRKISDLVAWYAGGNWKTHKIDKDVIHADFKGMFHADVELDDRNPRNLVVCPWNGMGSYVGFNLSLKADNVSGRVVFKLGNPYDMFGWNNNPDDYARVEQDYAKFLSFCRSADGLYFCSNANGTVVYVLSADSEQWFRMKQ